MIMPSILYRLPSLLYTGVGDEADIVMVSLNRETEDQK